MARDGNGNMTLPYPDFVAGTVISSAEVDANNSDIATALTQSIAVDGQSTITANLPMDNFKHTGVSSTAGRATRTEYPASGVVQDGDLLELSSVSGTDTITAAATPTITAYAQGQTFRFVAAGTNTGATTLNINSVGAAAIQKLGAALVAGDITTGDAVEVYYDGTQFQMLTPARTPVLTDGGIPGTKVSEATTDARGTIELATTAETQTGTATDRAVTPDGLADMTDLSNTSWMLDEDDMSSNDATKVPSQQSTKKYVDDNRGLVLLETLTPSAATTITTTATLDATYSSYEIEIEYLTTNTDDMVLKMLVSDGSTFKTGAADYDTMLDGTNANGTGAPYRSSSDAFAVVIGSSNATSGIGNAAGERASARIRFSDPQTSRVNHHFEVIRTTYEDPAGVLNSQAGSVRYAGGTTGAIAVAAIRFVGEAGTEELTAVIRVYGIK